MRPPWETWQPSKYGKGRSPLTPPICGSAKFSSRWCRASAAQRWRGCHYRSPVCRHGAFGFDCGQSAGGFRHAREPGGLGLRRFPGVHAHQSTWKRVLTHFTYGIPKHYRVKSGEFRGRDVTLTVADIQIEELPQDNGAPRAKGIVGFRETKKQLVLNRTNGECI